MNEFEKMNAYCRAANYLSVGQIYLLDNPLLKRPLKAKDIKPRLLGHFGTTPGLNFIYVHLNRIIKKNRLNMIFLAGPGHGAPGVIANTYLEGTYTEYYPKIRADETGLKALFKQFSFPGGIPSHTSPHTPGSIHEGGELGYSLAHAFGAVFDNPDLIAACVIGDGEAETGPLAASWHSNKFLNPVQDGAVLPILHLNGYKIAEPTVLARIPKKELEHLFLGYGYKPYFVEGDEPEKVHEIFAKTLDIVVLEIQTIQKEARTSGFKKRPIWPMIIFKTPKGWTGPKVIDGLHIEGSFRSHQVPIIDPIQNKDHLKLLEEWLRSYKPEELFDERGDLIAELKDLPPRGTYRMSANPHANGGLLLKELKLPDFKETPLLLEGRGKTKAESTKIMGAYLKNVMIMNEDLKNFLVFGPDETASNRLGSLFEITERKSTAEIFQTDDHISSKGRVLEILSEHLCEGWLEGYLLTGRHGLFSCYEAFIHIIDSMFNQHAKWLHISSQIPWRKPIASLNILLTSHVWRQDHNGFSHQDPGFLDIVLNKKADVVRVYLPPDANSLLSVTNHCLKSKNYVNVIVCGKHSAPQWLNIDEAISHCKKGISIWKWASDQSNSTPDLIMASAGDVPTLESLAATKLLRSYFPNLKIRFINVVDLLTLQTPGEHPHSLSDVAYNDLFPSDVPVIFAFHGYASLIHRLTYKRANSFHMHVRGFKEEGTTTTPFDMCVLNEIDRFNLCLAALDRLSFPSDSVQKKLQEKLLEHKKYIYEFGEDMPEIQNWEWEPS
jgi:xylulose-5-phosphate/fructose-6-phosphate phosphoketolase